MLNSLQFFGLVLLGALVAGEVARRLLALPQTIGYIAFGLAVGQSGLNWITQAHLDSVQNFFELALCVILFELGYRVPHCTPHDRRNRLMVGCALSLAAGLLVLALFIYWEFTLGSAFFAATLCIATSPAITIATCGDLGANGKRTGLLYTMVAINGTVTFAAMLLLIPFLIDNNPMSGVSRISLALGNISGSLVVGGACAGLVLIGAERLEKQGEFQHVLLLSALVLGIGTAAYLGISAFLTMLIFGLLLGTTDYDNKVIACGMSYDARVFLALTFVFTGAALDTAHLREYWFEAAIIILARLAGQLLTMQLSRKRLGLSSRESFFLSIGLQPMSSIALLLLVNAQILYNDMDVKLIGMLTATIILMQLLGPLATQTAIKGLGEASHQPSNRS